MGRRSFTTVVAFALLFVGLPFASPANASASGVVISEFRFRGPIGGNDEFVELYNTSSGPVDISGWKLQGCASATGVASDRATVPAERGLIPRTPLRPRRRQARTGPPR